MYIQLISSTGKWLKTSLCSPREKKIIKACDVIYEPYRIFLFTMIETKFYIQHLCISLDVAKNSVFKVLLPWSSFCDETIEKAFLGRVTVNNCHNTATY